MLITPVISSIFNKHLKIIIIGFLTFSILITSFFAGRNYSDKKWKLKFAELEKERLELIAKNKELETRAEKVSIKTITKYVDRIRYIEGKTNEVLKEVPIYITPEENAKCEIPEGFIVLHNKATDISP